MFSSFPQCPIITWNFFLLDSVTSSVLTLTDTGVSSLLQFSTCVDSFFFFGIFYLPICINFLILQMKKRNRNDVFYFLEERVLRRIISWEGDRLCFCLLVCPYDHWVSARVALSEFTVSRLTHNVWSWALGKIFLEWVVWTFNIWKVLFGFKGLRKNVNSNQ